MGRRCLAIGARLYRQDSDFLQLPEDGSVSLGKAATGTNFGYIKLLDLHVGKFVMFLGLKHGF